MLLLAGELSLSDTHKLCCFALCHCSVSLEDLGGVGGFNSNSLLQGQGQQSAGGGGSPNSTPSSSRAGSILSRFTGGN